MTILTILKSGSGFVYNRNDDIDRRRNIDDGETTE